MSTPGDARAEWFDAVEDYNPGGTVELAQRLHDEGLLFALNALVLHPLGLAIGVRARPEEGSDQRIVTALCLFRSDDPEGITFPAGSAARAGDKLEAAGHTHVGAVLNLVACAVSGGASTELVGLAERLRAS